jgi:hypothetical protein
LAEYPVFRIARDRLTQTTRNKMGKDVILYYSYFANRGKIAFYCRFFLRFFDFHGEGRPVQKAGATEMGLGGIFQGILNELILLNQAKKRNFALFLCKLSKMWTCGLDGWHQSP